jgi:multiple sugar transport system ATP-binding protein
MNFIPCQVEAANGAGLSVRLADNLQLPIPHSLASRYQPHVGKPGLILGLRPEHITEARGHEGPGFAPFTANLEVTEPMGMETLVYFAINGTPICGRVNPSAGARENAPMQLAVDLGNMHLIDGRSGLVI